MFADPQTITVSGTANTLPRVGSGDYNGTFSKDDGNLQMKVSHSLGKRIRRVIRVDHRKVAADPLSADQNLNYNMAMYIVVDVPPVGYTPAEVKAVWDGFLANLSASTAANTTKFLGGES